MKLLLLGLACCCTAACTTTDAPETDATLTLDQRTWQAGALFSDKLGLPSITISLAQDTDTDACAWYAPGSVDIDIPVDSRARPHVLPGFDAGSLPGTVVYFDDDQNAQAAVGGRVAVTGTTWGIGPDGHKADQIEAVEGSLDVYLADGGHLSGTFVANVCARD